jgi:PAS domain S-box-containing protein
VRVGSPGVGTLVAIVKLHYMENALKGHKARGTRPFSGQFQDLPIQRKMLVMTLLICGAVLCVAIAALFTFQVLNFRSNFQRDTATLAVIIVNNSTAALAFKDDKTAAEIVGSLQAKPSVVAASLVLPNGSVFAHFGAVEDAQARAQFPPAGEQRFAGGHLLVTQPVILKREQVGTLYLRSNYQRTFRQLLGLYAWIIFAVMGVSTGLAVFLSSRLGRRITDPILQLARTAQVIGEKKDYSVRANVINGADEVGRLTESFNEMLSRIQSQDAALSLSQQKMEALINSIDGIVWERTADTFRFTFVSRQSNDILGYSPEKWLERQNFWEEKLHSQDVSRVIETMHKMVSEGHDYTSEYRMVSADDRVVWLRESGTVIVEKDKPVAVRGIFQDITRQKLDAEQLDKLNRQLMSTSRLAGMAEVATGVLHNVGNVLNSVSVAATVVVERLRHSKIDKLQRATAMLRDKNGDLAEFLTNDPKGKVLPNYLATVADQMAGEQTKLVEKMDSLGKHVEHIKEIVAMQQSYAKVSGVYETLSVAGLVEDALRMNAAAFDRHGVNVDREVEPNTPSVCVDRHKVLQILVNVFRNAKYAMDELDPPVKIVVADNGIGIPAENLTKIFNHGFTTRDFGHGFGLHSGANAAKEMGGTLTAQSEGPGKGAEFTLELPTTATRQKAAMPIEASV